MIDVLIVSLGSTSGLRAADEELRDSLRRAGASVELVSAVAPTEVRTPMLNRSALGARCTARRRGGFAACPGPGSDLFKYHCGAAVAAGGCDSL